MSVSTSRLALLKANTPQRQRTLGDVSAEMPVQHLDAEELFLMKDPAGQSRQVVVESDEDDTASLAPTRTSSPTPSEASPRTSSPVSSEEANDHPDAPQPEPEMPKAVPAPMLRRRRRVPAARYTFEYTEEPASIQSELNARGPNAAAVSAVSAVAGFMAHSWLAVYISSYMRIPSFVPAHGGMDVPFSVRASLFCSLLVLGFLHILQTSHIRCVQHILAKLMPALLVPFCTIGMPCSFSANYEMFDDGTTVCRYSLIAGMLVILGVIPELPKPWYWHTIPMAMYFAMWMSMPAHNHAQLMAWAL